MVQSIPTIRKSFQALLAGTALVLASGVAKAEIVYRYDSVNRLDSRENTLDSTQSQSFDYDNNGNLKTVTVNGSVRIYVYDLLNRLVGVQQDGVWIARYGYDKEGRRNQKIDPNGTIHQYLYDGRHIMAEYDGAGVQVAKFDWVGNRLISLTFLNSGRFFPHYDGNGSITSLTDPTGNVVANYHLDAWGEPRFQSEINASENRFLYTGHFYDSETGLYQAQSRYYAPYVGRFTSQDAFLGSPDKPLSLNRYIYANANPNYYIDPDGHLSIRQMWGLDQDGSGWDYYGRKAAYIGWNIASIGFLGRQDKLQEQFDAGKISTLEFIAKTSGNVGTSAAIAAAATATGGYAAGAAAGLGATQVAAGAVGGVAGGLTAQGVSDVSEVGFLGTKQFEDVRRSDYALAAALGGGLGAGGAALSVRGVNINPNIGKAGGFFDRTIGQITRPIQETLTSISQSGIRAGRDGTTIAESPSQPGSMALVPYDAYNAYLAGGDPATVVPDPYYVVRGGTKEFPTGRTQYSTSVGRSVKEAAAGVPHKQVRVTTAGEIRMGGGVVEYAPERPRPDSPLNTQHANVTQDQPGQGYGELIRKTELPSNE